MKTILGLIVAATFLAGCSKSKSSYVNNPDAPDVLHNRPVGASANEILSASKYTALKIEVQYMPGYQPDPAALNHLQATLSGLLNKPGGITIVTKEIPASGKATLTLTEVIEIERKNRTAFTTGNELALYILYTDGNYSQNNVLGVAYKNTSTALFGKILHDNSGGLGQASRTKLVATVAEHEMGHLLGLVDLGSPMQSAHKDAAHGSHCSNTSCLMYYASETSDIFGFLITGNIPAFDISCKADMTANGGK